MKKLLTSLLLFCSLAGFAQTLKYEMRGTWLATVWQLNWPPSLISQTGNAASIASQKRSMTNILDSLQAANMNTVFFQVRSRCDAMYKSSYEPWSTDLVSVRGMDPGYDPLAFVVEEAHKRGIEVHAWVNPYRFESQVGQWSGMAGDYNVTNPDWVLKTGSSSILNPGMPEVRQRITDIIEEIVSGYDVDGIIFDDYFYLSGITNEDAEQQKLYNTEGLSVGDWRRGNVNKMIAQVYNRIQEIKPYVRFGVSPAGIWGGSSTAAIKYNVTQPVGIGSGYAYNGIYCDPLAWLSEGTIDYISPQIYWTIGSSGSDYATLAEWWSKVARQFGRHFYSSHSISALSASAAPSTRTRVKGQMIPSEGMSQIEKQIAAEDEGILTRATMAFGFQEVNNQIQCNRDYDLNDAPGSVFYSTSKFMSTKGFIANLRNDKFKTKVLNPAIFWKAAPVDAVVTDLALADGKVTWNCEVPNVRFAMYAIPVGADISQQELPKYFMGTSYGTQFVLPAGITSQTHRIGVAIVDRYGNESALNILGTEMNQVEAVSLIAPADLSEVIFPARFTWSAVDGVESYRIEISEQSDFSTLAVSKETTVNYVDSDDFYPLKTNTTYYWRVKSKKTGFVDGVSKTNSLLAIQFEILTPEDGATDVTLTPLISWHDLGEGSTYLVEIFNTLEFQNGLIYSKEVNTSSLQLPEEVLVGYATYYIRVTANYQGRTVPSSIKTIRTSEIQPDVPVILTPKQDDKLPVGTTTVNLAPDSRANGFRIEVSKTETFPGRGSKIVTLAAFNYSADFDLDEGLWYLRARSNYGTTSTAWSKTVTFTVSTQTALDQTAGATASYVVFTGETHLLYFSRQSVETLTVTLYDEAGQLQSKQIVPGGVSSVNLNTSRLERGVYVLRIQGGTETENLKLKK